MFLFAGLGNPGAAHSRQRHNVGFMALAAIAARHGFDPPRRRFQSLAAEGRIGGARVLALAPQTFMNESGRAVGAAMRYCALQPEAVVVFYDELDLPLGKVRLRAGGGFAGHKGIRSIAAHIGPEFHRVRIGIGHPGAGTEVSGHVLGNFSRAERAQIAPVLEAIAGNAACLTQGRGDLFANRVHLAGEQA